MLRSSWHVLRRYSTRSPSAPQVKKSHSPYFPRERLEAQVTEVCLQQTALVPLASTSKQYTNVWFPEMVHLFTMHQTMITSAQPSATSAHGGSEISKVPAWTTAARLARAYEHLTPLHQSQVPAELLVELLHDTLRLKHVRGTQRTWRACARLLKALEDRHVPLDSELLKQALGSGLAYYKKRLKGQGVAALGRGGASVTAALQSLLARSAKELNKIRIRPNASSSAASVVFSRLASSDLDLRLDALWCLVADPSILANTPTLVLFKHLRIILLDLHHHDHHLHDEHQTQVYYHDLQRLVEPILSRLCRFQSSRNALRAWQLLNRLRNSPLDLGSGALDHCAGLLLRHIRTSDIAEPAPSPEQRHSLLPPYLRLLPSQDTLLDELVWPSEKAAAAHSTPNHPNLRFSFALALLHRGFKSSTLFRSLFNLLASPQHAILEGPRLFALASALTIMPSGRLRTLTPQRKLGLAALLAAAVRLEHFTLAKHIYIILRNRASKTDPQWHIYLSLFSLVQPAHTLAIQPWLFLRSLEVDRRHQAPNFPIDLWQDLHSQDLLPQLSPQLVESFWHHAGSHCSSSDVLRLLSTTPGQLSSSSATIIVQASIKWGKVLTALRTLHLVLRHTPATSLSAEEVWNPLLFLISKAHTRRERLFFYVLQHMGELIDETSILAMMRMYSRRWDLTAADLEKVQAIRRNMVPQFAVRPDDRHQAEVIYSLLRRARLAEALLLFMDCEHPALVGSKIVGMLLVRLADASMYNEAQRVMVKWASERPLPQALAKTQHVARDESAVVVASLYVAARSSRAPQLDVATLRSMGVERVQAKAIKRLNDKLKKAVRTENESYPAS